MRQVPQYVLIGNGRLFSHFSHYLKIRDIDFIHWHRHLDLSFDDWYAKYTNNLLCKKIILLISDKAIEPFIIAHPEIPGDKWVHCSGALVTDLAMGLHPLGSFGPELYPDDGYDKIPFVLDSDSMHDITLFPELTNPRFIIPKEKKALYHSLCVLSNNFSCILWEKFFSELELQFQIPRQVIYGYLQQTMFNIQHCGPRALTGPLSRNDTVTIANNLAALEGDVFQKIYQAFVDIFNKK